VLGFFLLILRVKVAESFMFESAKLADITKGNFLMFFSSYQRFSKYIKAILIGLPTWFVIGVLVNYSNKFATGLYGDNLIDSGKSVMFAYIGIAFGDLFFDKTTANKSTSARHQNIFRISHKIKFRI
jgi:hypothetical protein